MASAGSLTFFLALLLGILVMEAPKYIADYLRSASHIGTTQPPLFAAADSGVSVEHPITTVKNEDRISTAGVVAEEGGASASCQFAGVARAAPEDIAEKVIEERQIIEVTANTEAKIASPAASVAVADSTVETTAEKTVAASLPLSSSAPDDAASFIPMTLTLADVTFVLDAISTLKLPPVCSAKLQQEGKPVESKDKRMHGLILSTLRDLERTWSNKNIEIGNEDQAAAALKNQKSLEAVKKAIYLAERFSPDFSQHPQPDIGFRDTIHRYLKRSLLL